MTELSGIPGRAFASVWDALEDSPTDAANMRLRSELMIAIRQEVAAWDVASAEAARRLDVTRSRLDDLVGGHISDFSVDALIVLATRAGLEVRMRVERAAA